MLTIPATQKAVVVPKKGAEFEVASNVDVPKPVAGQLLVKVLAAGLNPVDWKIKKYGVFVQSHPAILGTDAAGEVVLVGDGVKNFALGDRVLFQGAYTNANNLSSFQQYTLAIASTTAKIPANLSYEEAAAIPVALTAPALGFYTSKPIGVGLALAWEPEGRNKHVNEPFFVSGGATSVGQYAIQLARLSGFSTIITTASSTHTEFLKSLGATHIIDRYIPLSQLTSSISAITSLPVDYAFDGVSLPETQQATYDILGPTGQMVIVLDKKVKEVEGSKKAVTQVYGSVHAPAHKDKPVSLTLYSRLTELLESGDIKPNRIRVVPNGLQGIISGLKELEEGVSGVKLIVQPNN